MKRILFAVLLAAAPAFADRSDRQDRRDDDGYAQQQQDQDWSGNWDDEQYDWAPSDGTEGNWQSGDEAAPTSDSYVEERGPTLDDFRSDRELTWNGEWIETAEYGSVWRPSHVREDWQPYLYGRWVWTRAGWAWASEEPFGWAVYHYGRWTWSSDIGWMWVPGRIWAPAWVSWRWSDGYAAWCPMGPRSVVYDRPALWVVVPTRHFLEPVRHYVVPRRQRRTLPLPERPGPRAGPAVSVIERAVGRSVRPLPIGTAPTASGARAGSGSIDFYRPRTAPIVQPRIVAPSQSARPTGEYPRTGPRVEAPRPAGEYPRSGPQVDAPRPAGEYPRPAPRVEAPRPAGEYPRSGPRVEAPRPAGEYPPGDRPGNRPAAGSPQPSTAATPAAQSPAAQVQPPKVVIPHVVAPKQESAAAPHASAPKSNAEQPQAKER